MYNEWENKIDQLIDEYLVEWLLGLLPLLLAEVDDIRSFHTSWSAALK